MVPQEYEALVAHIAARLAEVRTEIDAAARRVGRDPATVRLVAVTKTHPADVLRAAVDAGATAIGENYLQEAAEKFAALGWPEAGVGAAPVVRHCIGHVQSNKARLAAQWFDLVETVDSLDLARRLDRLAAEVGRILPVLIQVNTSEELNKSGFSHKDVAGILPAMANLAHIRVDGLMTIGRFDPNFDAARTEFAALRELRNRLRPEAPAGIALSELSMGMSHDFSVAVEEGATIVRVGSRIFGSRV
jgi:pyridoxal phosphate enzyme (YggS family)